MEAVVSETKIQVPEGMLKAIRGRYVGNDNCGRYILEAALCWLSENPIVPTDGEAKAIWRDTGLCNEVDDDELRCIVVEWQRRMFLAPEPEVPSEIRDIDAWITVYLGSHPEIENIRRNFLLTFRRGQQSK